MFEILFIGLFILGYLMIAMEHPLKINKTATALVMGTGLWVLYRYALPAFEAGISPEVIVPTVESQLMETVGEIGETILLLLGAMTIVQVVDFHGGFSYVADVITTRDKRKLLWAIAGFTFVLSAVLDNMTTTIVMIMILRRIVGDRDLRLFYAGMTVIAANEGGAFSPIGDVTTIMLWVNGNVTAGSIVPMLLIPSIVSILLPLLIATPFLHGEVTPPEDTLVSAEEEELAELQHRMTGREKLIILALGVSVLLLTPVFKAVTHLPPFLAMLGGLGVIWGYTDIFYRRKRKYIKEGLMRHVSLVVQTVDISTLLFFFGILMSVKTLELTGILSSLATHLEVLGLEVQSFLIGAASSLVDNVPLVAASMGMYKIDPASTQLCVDGEFWNLIAFCAGTGGSLLIIGSAAGVIMMGLEKVSFAWYMRRITPLAVLGYIAGFAILILQTALMS
ncbi:sodium:proton antiporter NhaD [Porphyromonas sp.]|uniref:sodium:proton antiporter NhaD n=1 Tax=Porphyromonas sp. TaxID=1924944 RepID=UPI0026DD9D2F|nr:sodium:proton antiporter NhaD [Porphyromonas sp.]MDO4771306.1 sodium:proton antiporter NhaD [Porphyromonas sp.]